jgi:hypothetical protein
MIDKLIRIVERQQKSGQPITLRELARRLGVPQKTALAMCEEAELNINVAVGNSQGFADLNIADYTIENLS